MPSGWCVNILFSSKTQLPKAMMFHSFAMALYVSERTTKTQYVNIKKVVTTGRLTSHTAHHSGLVATQPNRILVNVLYIIGYRSSQPIPPQAYLLATLF